MGKNGWQLIIKNINMKQLLFLLLFPSLAMAQYTGNAGQKITLGEQTTADGLVYRGNAADTVAATLKITKTNKSDTSAFLLLDTINNVFLKYNIGTTFWTRLNILPTDTASMLSNYWRSGRFSGVLPVANGGTGQTTLAAANINTGTGTTNYLPKFTDTSTIGNSSIQDNGTIVTISSRIVGKNDFEQITIQRAADDTKQLIFDRTNTEAKIIAVTQGVGYVPLCLNPVGGNVGIGTSSPDYKLDVNGTVRFSNISTITNADQQNARLVIANSGSGGQSVNLIAGNPNVDQTGFSIAYGNTNFLRFTSTGEATFSSNVTATTGTFSAVGAGAYANDLNITSTGVLTTASSDEKYKYNILPINYGLNTILQLKPVNFQWIKGEENDLGFIAQDVADIIPEAVDTNWNSDLLMRYESIIPILTKAIQEQQALIKSLEQRILILENK